MWRPVLTRPFVHASLGLLIASLGLLIACGGGSTNHRPDALVARPRPTLRLLVVTDVDGALEPCGCTSRPLGGIDRMAAEMRVLRGQAPSLVLIAGNTFVGPEHSSEPTFAEQAALARATLLSILRELDTTVIAPGPADLSLGGDAFGLLAAGDTPAWLSADLGAPPAETPDAGAAAAPDAAAQAVTAPLQATTIRDVGGVRVGIFALMAPGDHGALRGPEDPPESARQAAASLRAEGAEFVVALASTGRRVTRQVARLEAVDVVIQAGLDRAEPLPPSAEGGALVLNGGRQGQRLMVIDVYRRGDGSFADASAWSAQAQAPGLRAEAATLEAQIAEWTRDGNADAQAIGRQRARLADLQHRASEAESAQEIIPDHGNVLAARLVELSPDAPRDPAIRQLLTTHDERVGETNRRVWADIAPTAAAEGEPRYVGAEACGTCHAAALAWWQTTPHGHAYATLQRVGKEFDLDCVGCHVTGYRRPGGSNVTHVGVLQSVGCEACHGPGSAHVAAPTEVALDTSPTTSVCAVCHTEAHSDLFDFDAYRAMLIVPGHGVQESP